MLQPTGQTDHVFMDIRMDNDDLFNSPVKELCTLFSSNQANSSSKHMAFSSPPTWTTIYNINLKTIGHVTITSVTTEMACLASSPRRTRRGGGLDAAGCDAGLPPVIAKQPVDLHSQLLEDADDEGVGDGHGFKEMKCLAFLASPVPMWSFLPSPRPPPSRPCPRSAGMPADSMSAQLFF